MFLGLPYFIWGLVVGSLVTLVGTLLSNRAAQKRDLRQAAETIAQHRIEWIERLREAVARVLGAAIEIHEKATPDEHWNAKFHTDIGYVILLLNQKEHAELYNCIRQYFEPASGQNQFDAQRLVELRKLTGQVLKSEWERAKLEIAGDSEALKNTIERAKQSRGSA